MLPRSTPHLSAATRDLRRDRSIIALAAALCGALSAAGIAALAVVSQLSANTEERAMSDVTAALETATEELQRSRDLLQESRRDLASAGASQPAEHHAHSCDHRPQIPPLKAVPAAHIVTAAPLPAPPPVAHPALSCDEEHRCTVHRDFLEAALFGAEGSRSRARVVPRLRDGVPIGMTIFAVRHGDPAELLGFRNRDTILAINGHPWRGMSLSGMIEHVRDVRAEDPDSLTVTLERNGEQVSKRFDLLQ